MSEQEVIEKRFGGNQVKADYAGYKKSKAVIIQCPYDLTACYKKGTKKGPAAIIDASEHIELFDEELKTETFRAGIFTMPPLPIEELPPEKMIETVKKEVEGVIRDEKVPVVIGGEHSVSIGAVKAVSEMCKDVTVLHFDAHHDLRDEYENSKFSHACVARRFLESCPVMQVGMRSLSKDEQDFINSNPPNLKVMNVYDILDTATWKEQIVKNLSDNVYISLDIDVFDPSIFPSTGTPEPGGIGWYELLELLKMVSRYKKIVGFDVVELMPIENMVAPDFVAAKLIYRLIGYTFYGNRK